MADLPALQNLRLSSNPIGGTLPSELSAIVYLALESCSISGTLPSTLVQYNAMLQLSLGYNSLSGTVPSLTHLGNLSILCVPVQLGTHSFLQESSRESVLWTTTSIVSARENTASVVSGYYSDI